MPPGKKNFFDLLLGRGGLEQIAQNRLFWLIWVIPLAKFFREPTIPSRGMIILKIFRFMHFVFKKKFLLGARAHKAHFCTHKYEVWISKKTKNWAKYTIEIFVPVVCVLNKKFCETTKVKWCLEIHVIPFLLILSHYVHTTKKS